MYKPYVIDRLVYLTLCFTLCFGLVDSSVKAQSQADTISFSLREAIDYAVKNNLNVANSRLDVQAAEGQVMEVKSVGLPQVNGSLNYQRNLKLPAQLVPGEAFGQPDQEFIELVFGTKNNMNAGIEATQLVFDGSYLLGLKAARLFVERAQMQAEQSEYDIKDVIAKNYLAVLIAEENLGILNKNIKVIERVLFETEQLHQNGFVEQLEVDRLLLSQANLKTQLRNLNEQVVLLHKVLKFQMGIPLHEPIKLSEDLQSFVNEAEKQAVSGVNQLTETAMQQRIELKLLGIQNIFRDLDIRQVKAQYLPSLVAYASLQTSFQSDNFKLFDFDRWLPSAAVGFQITIPIFDGFQKKGQLQQRYVTQQQAFKREVLTKQAISLEVEQAYTQYTTALEQVAHQKNNINLAEKIYNTTLIKYKEGLGSSLEVTNAESQLYDTQRLYIQALYDLVIAKTNINKATGNY